MKRISRLLALLLILAGVIVVCCPGLAEDSDWTFNEAEEKLTGYTGPGGDVTVPAKINGVPIRTLDTSVLSQHPDVQSVVVSEGILLLKNSTCAWNEQLTRVQLPDSLLVIEDGSLCNNPMLEELVIPPEVCWVGDGCFGFNSSLRKITFTGPCPEFGGSCLSAVPDDAVAAVPDDEVKAYTAALKRAQSSIAVEPSGRNAIRSEPKYDTENLVFDKETGTVTGYTGGNVRLDIPSAIEGTPVKAIGNGAFERNGTLSYVTLPDGVETIGEGAFSLVQSLHVVRLPAALIAIGDRAFEGSYRTGTLTFPEGLASIGKQAFSHSTVRGKIKFPATLQTIGEGAFDHCAWLSELEIPAAVTEIGDSAFEACGLTYIYMDGLTLPALGTNVFLQCSGLSDIDLNTRCTRQQMLDLQAYVDDLGLTCRVWRNQNPAVQYMSRDAVTYQEAPDGTMMLTAYTGTASNVRPHDLYDQKNVTGIADGALKGNTAVTYFSVPYNDVFTYIGAEAFADSALEQVDLFDSVTTIGPGAFRNCTHLKEVTLPASVSSIGEDAFAGCTSLRKVTVLCDGDIVPASAFAGCAVEELYLAESATEGQITALSERLGLPWYRPGLRMGQKSAFETMPFVPTDESQFTFDADTGTVTAYNGQETDVVIPRAIGGVPVTAIGYNTFQSAWDYTHTEITSNRIDWLRLRSVVIPETVRTIDDSLFNYCQQLETVICYAPLETTAKSTFTLCRGLKNVVFVNGLRTIDSYCFRDTESLETVYTPRHLTRIDTSAFQSSGIKAFVVDADTVAAEAFLNCPNLSALRFTAACQQLEAGCVNSCPSLQTITYDGSDLSYVPHDGVVFGARSDVTARVQEGLSEEAMEKARRTLAWSAEMPALHIEAGNWTTEAPVMPDVEGMMAAYGIKKDTSTP